MSTVIKRTLDEQYLDGLAEWCALHPDAIQWDNGEVAQWLIDNRKFGLERRLVRKEIAKRLAKAQNRRKVRNEQGKRVREYHAALLPVAGVKPGKVVQKVFWTHRLIMAASFAHTSFEQRQKQAEGFCRSMNNDAQDVNENNANLEGNPVQLDLDFSFVAGQQKPQPVQTIPVGATFEPAQHNKKLQKKKPR